MQAVILGVMELLSRLDGFRIIAEIAGDHVLVMLGSVPHPEVQVL